MSSPSTASNELIEKRMKDLEQRLEACEDSHKKTLESIKAVTIHVDEIKKTLDSDLKEIVTAFRDVKGFAKTMGRLATIGKWVALLAGAIATVSYFNKTGVWKLP